MRTHHHCCSLAKSGPPNAAPFTGEQFTAVLTKTRESRAAYKYRRTKTNRLRHISLRELASQLSATQETLGAHNNGLSSRSRKRSPRGLHVCLKQGVSSLPRDCQKIFRTIGTRTRPLKQCRQHHHPRHGHRGIPFDPLNNNRYTVYFTNAPALAVSLLLLVPPPGEEDMDATRRSMSTSPTVGNASTAPLCSSTLSATRRQATGFWKLSTCSATDWWASGNHGGGGRDTGMRTPDQGELQHFGRVGGKETDTTAGKLATLR